MKTEERDSTSGKDSSVTWFPDDVRAERYLKMINEIQDYAIILLDERGNILNWNLGAEKIKQYKPSEIIGKNFSVFYMAEDRERALPETLITEAAQNGRAIHEGWRVRKDGSRFWGSITITALHNNHNTVIGFTKVTRDLTEKKESEEQLLRYTAELEAQNIELEQFAYVASHDLQEPLRKIQTFANMLERDLTNEQQVRKYLDKIKISAGRMSDLIKSLLNYSRLINDEGVLTPIDLNAILHQVRTDFELLMEEKQAKIESDNLPPIIGDFSQITQLFANLIGNSLKFSKEHPAITIRCQYLSKEHIGTDSGLNTKKDHIQLSFHDNGIGFNQHFEGKIFTMFQRLHSKEQYSGTGIGLALCKRIVENHHGTIRAESVLGQGATFFVTLPVN